MSRTPLMQRLRRIIRNAARPQDENAPAPRPPLSRRRFLRDSAAAAAALAAGATLGGCATGERRSARAAPRVAIVGGGIAGLNAASHLNRAGIRATVYEAAARTGGRIFSGRNLLAEGLVTEIGAEFIDSSHTDLLALADRFQLERLDVAIPEEAAFHEAYYFDGRQLAESEFVEAFRPYSLRIAADAAGLGDAIDYRHVEPARPLDRLSLADYFDRLRLDGALRKLLEVAYVTEYGLDAGEQSALNFITLVGTDLAAGRLKLYGESDERYKIRGGNQQIVDALAAELPGQIEYGHRLTRVAASGAGFRLSFDRSGGGSREINADLVLLTIPFTLLRGVELRLELPPVKKKAIAELGYGKGLKLMAGFSRRVWRESGHNGDLFSDEPFQLAWDSSRLQGGKAGTLTLFSGGVASDAAAAGRPAEQLARLLPGVEKAFPGVSAAHTGRVERFAWLHHPLTLGSYSCYKPGQWTSIGGAEGEPVGNLLFAGEHCSREFQGFMNGAAQTGRQAAEAIAQRVRA